MQGQAALDRAANHGMSPVLLKGRMGSAQPPKRLQILCSSLMRVKAILSGIERQNVFANVSSREQWPLTTAPSIGNNRERSSDCGGTC
jgi:hypothetical protein